MSFWNIPIIGIYLFSMLNIGNLFIFSDHEQLRAVGAPDLPTTLSHGTAHATGSPFARWFLWNLKQQFHKFIIHYKMMSTFVNKVPIPQLKKRKINISCEILIKFETELHLISYFGLFWQKYFEIFYKVDYVFT